LMTIRQLAALLVDHPSPVVADALRHLTSYANTIDQDVVLP
jgi:hypothetical protein